MTPENEDEYTQKIAQLIELRAYFRAHGQDVELFPLDDETDTGHQPWGPDHPDYDEMGQ